MPSVDATGGKEEETNTRKKCRKKFEKERPERLLHLLLKNKFQTFSYLKENILQDF